MPLKIERSDQSELDLLEIWDFVSERDERAADRLLLRFLGLLEQLANHPEMGRARPDLGEGIRSIPATDSYGIFYSFDATHVRLLRVMHFARDVTSEALEVE
jgi:toxin ParE1/3/4